MRISGLRDNLNISTQKGLDGYLVFKIPQCIEGLEFRYLFEGFDVM